MSVETIHDCHPNIKQRHQPHREFKPHSRTHNHNINPSEARVRAKLLRSCHINGNNCVYCQMVYDRIDSGVLCVIVQGNGLFTGMWG